MKKVLLFALAIAATTAICMTYCKNQVTDLTKEWKSIAVSSYVTGYENGAVAVTKIIRDPNPNTKIEFNYYLTADSTQYFNAIFHE